MAETDTQLATYTVGGSGYFDAAFDDADSLISKAEITLRGLQIDFDSMVAIGLSGHLVLPLLARHFGVPFLALRKPGVESHDTYGGGRFGRGTIGRRYIIVDDFVCTGNTIRNVQQRIADAVQYCCIPFTPEYVGTYTYAKFASKKAGTFHFANGKQVHPYKIKFAGEVVYVNEDHFSEIQEAYYRALRMQLKDPKGYAITEAQRYTDCSVGELAKMAIYAERLAQEDSDFSPED
jgi:hypothetical protein